MYVCMYLVQADMGCWMELEVCTRVRVFFFFFFFFFFFPSFFPELLAAMLSGSNSICSSMYICACECGCPV